MKAIRFLLLSIIIAFGFYSCEKTVNVTGVTLDKNNIVLIVGDTELLTATIEPTDANDKNISWTSSDATIASVIQGQVTAISQGTATITVTTADGSYTATCTVTVETDAVNVTGIALNETTLNLITGDTKQLTATIQPTDATDQTVTWVTSDDGVATVSSTGLITAVGAGSATITVTTTDGAKTATCEVRVTVVGTITEIMTKGFITNADLRSIDLACDANGIPYIANITNHTSESSKGLVQVHKYGGSGTTWSKFSGKDVGISGAESYTPSLAIKDDGTVIVAYQYLDDINDNRYGLEIAAAYDGSNWITLGGEGVDNNNCLVLGGASFNQGARTQMAFKQDGTLMLAASHYGDGYVQYYDNSGDWTMLSAGDWKTYTGYKLDNDDFWSGNVNLAIDGNKPYAYIRSGSGTARCGVLSGPETNGENVKWEWLGSLVGNETGGHQDFETPLALSSTGEIYTSYQKASGIQRNVYVKHFNKTNDAWEIIFTKDFEYFQNEAEVVISNDILYLVVARYDEGIEVYKYDSEQNSWNFEGKTSDFGATYYTIDLAPGNNGEFYIAYSITDSGSDYEIGAFKYTPVQSSK